MNESNNNLLLLLHKWASRQDENFTTEAFVHLLRHLLDHEPKVAVCILSKLTNSIMNLSEHEIDEVELATQVVLQEGRPDFTIRTTNHLIYAEVKVSSTLTQGQLASYRHELNNADEPHRALIFISQYAETMPIGEEPDFQVRWYTIADWLETEIRNNSFSQPSSAHVLNQFVGFLKGRNMTMERVTWELIGGIQSLMSLLAMIEAALVAENVKFKRSDARDWIGCNIENKKYFLVMRFERPNVLVFHN